MAAVMSQFRVDEIGHAKIISVNLCVAANCALVLPRGIRLQLLRLGCVFESLKFVQPKENLLFPNRSFDVEENDSHLGR